MNSFDICFQWNMRFSAWLERSKKSVSRKMILTSQREYPKESSIIVLSLQNGLTNAKWSPSFYRILQFNNFANRTKCERVFDFMFCDTHWLSLLD